MRGAKLFVKGYDGNACGPFRWTAVREWMAVGYFTPHDEVRLADEAAWSPIGALPELLATPPGDDTNEALNLLRVRAREKKAVGPRAAAYLKRLGCPVRPERLNHYTAFEWVRILEELNPQLTDATEHWAAEEESKDRVPSASPNDATAAQLESLRSIGRTEPGNLTRLEAHRLISGPPTDGQLRRLKFYGITLAAGACKDEAAELIDRHMRENWDSEQAYQASRRRLDPEESGGSKPVSVLRLRQPLVPAIAETVSAPVARSFPPLAPPVPQILAPRPTASKYAVVSCLIGLGIIVVAWSIARRRPGADLTQIAPRAAGLQGPEEAAPDPKLARTVILLESPNRSQGEQLRAFAISLPLTGIIGGPEPRALIDGRMFRVGDMIARPRGVVILQIDLDKKSVAFGDAAGSIVQRVLE